MFAIYKRQGAGTAPTNGKEYTTVRAAVIDAVWLAQLQITTPNPLIIYDESRTGPDGVAAYVFTDGRVEYRPGYGPLTLWREAPLDESTA